MNKIRKLLLGVLIVLSTMTAATLPASAEPQFCSGDRVYSQVLQEYGTVDPGGDFIRWDDALGSIDLDDARTNLRLLNCNLPAYP